MRVCIDVSPAVHGRAGIGRYAGELARALAARSGGKDLQLFYNRAREARPEGDLAALPALRSDLEDRPWKLRVMSSHFPGGGLDREFPGVDVFHATDHLLPRFRRLRSVFTLHDLAFREVPGAFPVAHRLYQSAMMPRFLQASDLILAVSETTRAEAMRSYRIPEDRIRVVYPGVDARFAPPPAGERARVRAELSLPPRYLLYVGTLEPRKNLERLLQAFDEVARQDASLSLVLAGRKGWMAEDLVAGLKARGAESRVRFTGFVRDEDLPALYAEAEAFVYPSLYEGFGSPVLEAMACGTAVVCSEIGALREVTGDAAVRFAPKDTHAMAQALRRVSGDAALRANLGGAGLVRSRMFSWDRAARETEVAYREAARASLVARANYSE